MTAPQSYMHFNTPQVLKVKKISGKMYLHKKDDPSKLI